MVASAIAAAATIGGSLIASNASKKASKAQTQAANRASDVQRQNFLDFVELNRPAIEAGDQARSQLLTALGLGEGGREGQTAFFRDFQTDPGFQEGINRGIQSIDQSAAARGTLNSGRTLKDVASFTTDQFLNNAFNNRLNRLGSLAGAGQSAINTQGQFGQTTANNIGNNLISAGNAQASGFINQSNAFNQGINNINTLLGDNAGSINSFFGFGGGGSSVPAPTRNPFRLG